MTMFTADKEIKYGFSRFSRDYYNSEISPSEITITTKRNGNVSHLAQFDGGYRFGVDKEKWNSFDDEQRLVTLTHHIPHCSQFGYNQQFWVDVFGIWKRMLDDRNVPSVDWEWVCNRMHAIYGANTPTKRKSQLLSILEDITGYKYEWYVTLDHPSDSPILASWDEYIEVSPNKVLLEESYSDQELVNFYQQLEGTQYGFELPQIVGEHTPEGITVVSGFRSASLLLRRGTDRFPIIIR